MHLTIKKHPKSALDFKISLGYFLLYKLSLNMEICYYPESGKYGHGQYLRIFPVSVTTKYYLTKSKLKCYALAGANGIYMKFWDWDYGDSGIHSYGIDLGAGALYPIAKKMNLGFQVKYQSYHGFLETYNNGSEQFEIATSVGYVF